jgi:Arc/MetJ family transcription regulator
MEKTIEIADELVKAAQDATGETDERAAIETAVKGYLGKTTGGKQRRLSLSRHAGTFEFADGYDVLKERGARGLPD